MSPSDPLSAATAGQRFVLGYRPALDGLRAVAIAMVLWHHAVAVFPGSPSWAPLGGFLGVDLFFVLSGFLITSLLLERRRADGHGVAAFYGRRARRLLPALAVYLVVHGAFASLVGRDLAVEIRTTLAALVYISNWGEVWQWELAGDQLHLWSLAIEEQFYLAWPWVLLALSRVRLHSALAGAAAVVVAVGIWRAALIEQDGVRAVLFRTDTRIDTLLIGSALAIALHAGWRPPAWLRRHGARVGAVTLIIACIGGVALVKAGRGITLSFVAGAAALLVLAALTPRRGSLLTAAPLVGLGRCSYSMYLWHLLVFQVVAALVSSSFWTGLAVGSLATSAVAAVSLRFVERPFLQRPAPQQSIATAVPSRRRSPLVSVAAGALALVGAGVTSAWAYGDDPRAPADAEVAAPGSEPSPAGSTPPPAEPAGAPGAVASPPTASPSIPPSASPSPSPAPGEDGRRDDPAVVPPRVATVLVVQPPTVVTAGPAGPRVELAATLTDGDRHPIGGAPIELRIELGDVATSCHGVSDDSGVVRCQPAVDPALPEGPAVVVADFQGDGRLAPASDRWPDD